MELIREGLDLLQQIDHLDKIKAIRILSNILKEGYCIELGYDKLIFRELVKHSQFEEDCLEEALSLLEEHYYKNDKFHDELAELLIYRIARSNKDTVSEVCLKKLLSLIDFIDESVAKHSKQILNLADFNHMANNIHLINILTKMETKLSTRKQILFYNE